MFQLRIGKIAIEKHLHFLDIDCHLTIEVLICLSPCHLFVLNVFESSCCLMIHEWLIFQATLVIGHPSAYSLYSFCYTSLDWLILSYYRTVVLAHPFI